MWQWLGGAAVSAGIPAYMWLTDKSGLRKDLMGKDEDPKSGYHDFNAFDNLRDYFTGYSKGYDSLEDALDAEKQAKKLNDEAEADRITRRRYSLLEESPEYKLKQAAALLNEEVLRGKLANEAAQLGIQRTNAANTHAYNMFNAQSTHDASVRKHDIDKATIRGQILALQGKEKQGLAELDLRRQMEENRMQQFREQQEFNREERREKRIQMIMDALNGLTRTNYYY